MARLSQPESKRATVEALANQAGITLNLDSVYRSMDYLDAPMIDKVCRMSHAAAEKLLEGPVDVLFYDCATKRRIAFWPRASARMADITAVRSCWH